MKISKIALVLVLAVITKCSCTTYKLPRYEIMKERVQEIRSELLYWFFDEGGSNGNGDYQINIKPSAPQIQKDFNFNLPFYGFIYNYTRVSLNGYLEFTDGPETYKEYPLVFPRNYPTQKDPSFIGPFFSKMTLGYIRDEDEDKRRAGVYYRVEENLPGRLDQFGVELRERLTKDIREGGVIGAQDFTPKHAIITTWKSLSFQGGIEAAKYLTNTFQLVLATDESTTYVIFNYANNIQWTTHTEAGGDSKWGDGGVPAYIGFNAGHGTRAFEYLPYSQRSSVRDLTWSGCANGFRGRHVFRIDGKIMPGTCSNDTNTFQLVLATDESTTYVIFNYANNIQWTTHTEAGGDSKWGDGGVPAYIGFNAGHGTRAFEYLPYSQRSSVRDLTWSGCANGFRGRHVFRIDGKIMPGTCSNDMDYICRLYLDEKNQGTTKNSWIVRN